MRKEYIRHMNEAEIAIVDRIGRVYSVLASGEWMYVKEILQVLCEESSFFVAKDSMTNTLQSLWLRGKVKRLRIRRNFVWCVVAEDVYSSQLALDILCYIRRCQLRGQPKVTLASEIASNFGITLDVVKEVCKALSDKGLLQVLRGGIPAYSTEVDPAWLGDAMYHELIERGKRGGSAPSFASVYYLEDPQDKHKKELEAELAAARFRVLELERLLLASKRS